MFSNSRFHLDITGDIDKSHYIFFQSHDPRGRSRSPARSYMGLFVAVVDGFLDSCKGGVTAAQCFTLRKIPKFRVFSWCGSFVERHSFGIVSGHSPETMPRLCLSTKFPYQEIRLNYGILRSVTYIET